MAKPTLSPTLAAAVVVTTCAATLSPVDAGTAAANPTGGTVDPFVSALRACDFTFLMNKMYWGDMHAGYGQAVIRTSGNTVTAEVEFTNTRRPGTHYDVGLIQVPRETSSPCGPGAPGTVFTGMDIDPGGRGAVTLSDTIRSGTTGVWVKVSVPSPHSQDPQEFYSSSFIAHV